MNIFNYFIFIFYFLNISICLSKCCCCKNNKNNNISDNNDKKDDNENVDKNKDKKDKKENDNEEDNETNHELDCIILKELTPEKLEEVKNYYKDKFDINKEKNRKLYEEDHNWIGNYTFNYKENTKNIPGYIQWTGTTCSMCSVLNALYGLEQFRNFLKKDNLLDNLDDYLKIIYTYLDDEYSPSIDDFYNFFNINLFDFLKKIFNNFDDNKIITSTADLHKKYVRLILNYFISKGELNKKIDENLHYNLLEGILSKFAKIFFSFGNKDGNITEFNYSFNLSLFESRDLNSMIVEYVKKEAMLDPDKKARLCAINNILHFRIFKRIDDEIVCDTNLFEEIKITDNLDLETIFDCSDFFKKNPDLKGKLKYKLKSIIIHCGPNSTGGDYSCFRKDDSEDKYWHFQMNKELTKYTLNEINNMKNFAGYNTVSTIDLLFEL